MSGKNPGHSSRLEELMDSLPELIPGAGKALLVFYDAGQEVVIARSMEFLRDSEKAEWLDTSPVLTEVNVQRARTFQFEWMLEEELPFSHKPMKSGQIDIFTSLRKDVLLIGLPNPTDGLNDLLYIHLTGLSNEDTVKGIRKGIDQAGRDYIGLMASRSLRFFLARFNSQEDRKDRFMQQTRESYRNFLRERENFRRTGLRYGESLLRLAEARLNDLQRKYRAVFVLNEGAREAIRTYPGDITQMLIRLNNAADYAYELYNSSNEAEIPIEDWFLEVVTYVTNEEKQVDIPDVATKGALTRTVELLDKLEEAARKAENSSQKLTSANVGRMCPTPISAPAITDSIRNHRDRIIQLLQRYPERWLVIRNRFRPIINALESSAHLLDKESA